jgi:hypothetical protein
VDNCDDMNEWNERRMVNPCKAIELNKPGGCKITACTNVYLQLITTSLAQQLKRMVSSLFTWDSDSFLLVLDTGSSHHMINNKSLFIGDINSIKNVFLLNGVDG